MSDTRRHRDFWYLVSKAEGIISGDYNKAVVKQQKKAHGGLFNTRIVKGNDSDLSELTINQRWLTTEK